MKRNNSKSIAQLATLAALAGSQFCATHVRAQESTNQVDNINALLQRIQELEQKVKVLERNREVDAETAEAAAQQAKKDLPQITLGQNGFAFKSANGNFAVRLGGLVQLDSHTFFDDHGIPANDGFILRRARPILEGTVFRDFDFLFVPDFGPSTPVIQDAYLNYRYSPEVQFRFGKFKEPVGLELLQSDSWLPFNERSLVTDLVPNRDIGVMFHGLALDSVVGYQAGIFNGVGDAVSSSNRDIDDDKEFAGRLFFHPFRKTDWALLQGFGFGLGGSYEENGSGRVAAGLPSNSGYATEGQQQFFVYTNGVAAAGEHWRLSPQAYYYHGPFSLLGEYAISNQRVDLGSAARRLENKAWQITGSWVITGEENTYNGVTPEQPFDLRAGRWGAWQLVARYSKLNIDDAAFPTFADPLSSASEAQAWSVGLNWWLNRNVRILTSFTHTSFQGGGGGTGTPTSGPAFVTRQPEKVLFTRVQLYF